MARRSTAQGRRRWRWTLPLLCLLALAGCGEREQAGVPNPLSGGAAEGLGFMVAPTLEAVPNIAFTQADGKPLTLQALRGKIVVLNLWATWCTPCREEMPTLDALQGELGGENFEVVALSVDRDGLPVVEKFFQDIGVAHLATYLDERGRAPAQLAALGLPTTLLLDREGREMARLVGIADWHSPEMTAFLRSLIAPSSNAAAD